MDASYFYEALVNVIIFCEHHLKFCDCKAHIVNQIPDFDKPGYDCSCDFIIEKPGYVFHWSMCSLLTCT